MREMERRLLFLFSDTGAGHRACAEAVAAALDIRFPDAFKVDLFDPLTRERALLSGRVTGLYGPITRYLPAAWGALYRATNFRPVVRGVQGTLGRGLRPKLRRALEDKPALVASFHPMLNHIAADVMPEPIPLVTVITDWIDFHRAWNDPRVSCVICPSRAAYDLCRRRGVPEDHLRWGNGLPIHPRFADAIARYPARAVARRSLGLRPHARTVLLVGGGDGTEPLRAYARALAESPLDLQVLVVCGRNEPLARRIRADSHDGVHVYGFVQNMPELMLASDLLITRAGPGMIAEGLACGCPLLLTGRLPGQEEANVDEVLRRHLGWFCPRPQQLVTAVTDWYGKPDGERAADQARARAAGNPNRAFEVATVLAEMARSAGGTRAE
jgi:1,2-diacylglycerol 3-beta-galactosyltransferase